MLQKGKQQNGRRKPTQRTGQEAVGIDRCRKSEDNKQPNSSRQRKNSMAGKHRTKVQKGAKMTKVAYNMKIKKYTHEGKEIPVEEPIRLDIPDSYIYFSFHPTKNKYVMIDAPNRKEPDAKFVITAPFCHWIRERNITVIALLSYATRTTHSNIRQ